MALLSIANTLPASSQEAFQIFDERYLAAIAQHLDGNPSTWVDQLGDFLPTESPTTQFPMSFLALKYEETIEQSGRFRTIGEKLVELGVSEFDDGVEIELMKLMTNSFSAAQWEQAPAAFIKAEQRFRNRLITTMLDANTELCGWDGLPIFHDAHLANPKDDSKGTFDNLQASAKDVVSLTNIEAEITLMLEVKDLNGEILGVMPDTVGVPRQKWQGLKNLLKQDFVPNSAGTATMRNPYNDNSLNVVRIDDSGDANDWYLFDSSMIARGVSPWILAKLGIKKPGFDDLSLRRYDTDSPEFRKSGKIGVSSHIYYGKKFLFPHAIRKIVGA